MKSRGFTIIELLIVMAVISILIAIAIPSFKGMQQEARKTKALGDLRTIKTAIEAYYMDHRNLYPAEASYEASLVASVPQILPNVLYDPFGATSTTQYIYQLDSHNPSTATYYIIYSVGPARTATAAVSTSGIVTASTDAIWISNGH
jgi:prepilin-type N-terminal cleavage/methylation domain-containing protein